MYGAKILYGAQENVLKPLMKPKYTSRGYPQIVLKLFWHKFTKICKHDDITAGRKH